jgi:aspartyl-tRNA synthetase
VPDRPIQQLPFPRIDYHEAIERYGSDKPDLRFGMELVDLVPAMGPGETGFRVFDETLAAGGRVKAFAAPTMGESSRSQIDELVAFARRFGAKGLAHVSVTAEGTGHSPIAKFLGDERVAAIVKAMSGKPGDLILIVADPDHEVVADVLGRLRQELGLRLGLADENILAYCWVYHFPMYQWEADLGRWHATHNPFSGVVPEDEKLLVTASGDPYKPSHEDPAGKARAMQYDIALNGWELGGGSVRIHKRELLERSFALQGYSHEQMYERFGGLLEAFDYGAPPHGGIAMGIDRWAALFSHQTNIREVMAFPKTQSGTDLMLGSPSEPDAEQYSELGLRFVGIGTAGDAAKSEPTE